jgi:hypothetical protein
MQVKHSALLLALAGSVILAGCGSSSSSTTTSASDLPAVALTPTNGASLINAVTGKTFAFPGTAGVPALGTTGPTSVAFSGQNFTITQTGSSAGSYSGTMSYGSCIFTVTATSLSTVKIGDKITVNPCSLDINTAGQGTGSTQDRPVTLVLGTTTSIPTAVPVLVTAQGEVIVNGTSAGSVPTPTGSTGSGS